MFKKVLVLTLVLSVCLVGLTACTKQNRAKAFGGNFTLDVPPGQKVVNVTWKEGSALWYLTRPMHDDEKAETFVFRESSSFGLMQGTVTLVEHKATP